MTLKSKLMVLVSRCTIDNYHFCICRLMSGILQLSSDTNLVLDETQMQPGKLETDGVNNLKALGNLIQWQNVEYDFKFSQVEMRTKVNTLVLSEGM